MIRRFWASLRVWLICLRQPAPPPCDPDDPGTWPPLNPEGNRP